MADYVPRNTNNAPQNKYQEMEDMWKEMYPDILSPGYSDDMYESLYNIKTQYKLPEGSLSGVANHGIADMRPKPERYGSEPIQISNNAESTDRENRRQAWARKVPTPMITGINPETGPDFSGGVNNFVPASAVQRAQQNAGTQPVNTQAPNAYNPYDNKEFRPGVSNAQPLPNTTDRRFSPQWSKAMSEAYLDSNPNVGMVTANDNPYDDNSQRGQRYRQLSQKLYGTQDPSFQAGVQNMNLARATSGTLAQQQFSSMDDLQQSGMTAEQMVNWKNTRGAPTAAKPQYARLAGDYNDMTDYERSERSRMGLNSKSQEQPDTRRQEYLSRVANKPLPQRDMRPAQRETRQAQYDDNQLQHRTNAASQLTKYDEQPDYNAGRQTQPTTNLPKKENQNGFINF